MTEIPEYIRHEAKKELARRFFYDYCQLRYPKLYTDKRPYLKEVCDKIQWFVEQNNKRFLIINLPPRFLKSLTGTCLVEWLFGKNNKLKVMTGSYNETLSTTFARKVRDTIDEQPSLGIEVYNNLFPDTKVKYGQASKSLWALEGSGQDNYLATSPTGTATGFGANYIILDDIIKNAEEAYNQMILDKHWDWFTNTMMSRTEGNDWKVIAIMTRWAKDDLAGKIIDNYGDLAEVITFKAVNDDGTMLCDDILNAEDYKIKTQEMAIEIVEANYNQKPIDIEGRLYNSFQEYDTIPDSPIKYNFTDTADTGNDWLCSVDCILANNNAYVTDVVMSDKPMEITEPLVAQMLHFDGVNQSLVESNNGGRGFGRNIERLLQDTYKNYKCVITPVKQTHNKEARILTSSAWVKNHLFMPHGWQNKYPDFYKQIVGYQAKGKNAHDDACFPAGTMVATVFGDKPIEQIKIGDKLITPFGVGVVKDCAMTGIKYIIKKDGNVATPNHKYFDGDKFTRLDMFTGIYDIMSIWKLINWKYKKLLLSMETHIDSWGRESIILANQVQIKDEKVRKDFIVRFGSFIVVKQYQKAILFTIKTATLLIMSILIWSVYQTLNMLKGTKIHGIKLNQLNTLYRKQQNGTKANKVENGTLRAQSRDGKMLKINRLRVFFARLFSKVHMLIQNSALNGVGQNIDCDKAKEITVKNVARTSRLKTQGQDTAQIGVNTNLGLMEVYNITVDFGCYYANRVLVSNCDVTASIYEFATASQTEYASAADLI